MKRSSFSLRMAVGLAVAAAVGVAPFVFRALRASEAPVPTVALRAGDEANNEQGDAEPKEQSKPSREAKAQSTDPYAVPEGSVEELIDFINDVQKVKPKGDSEEAELENSNRVASAVVTAAERILAQDPSDDEARAVARVAFQALWHLVSIEDETALARIDALIEKLSTDRRPGMAELTLQNSLIRSIKTWDTMSDDEKAAFATEMKKYLTADELSQEKLQMAMGVAEMLEQSGAYTTAAAVYEAVIDVLPQTRQAAEVVEQMQATVRRLQLPGKFMEISGTRLDGAKFDWNAYRGKVVLVDFWATWCGPCIKELPNVLANYRKYHAKGFDVVGISLDDDTTQVEDFLADRKIPWVTLIDQDPDKRGWNSPLANQYGISGIPAAILVDQEGKVVSLAAYGEELETQLAKLLGDGEKPTDEK